MRTLNHPAFHFVGLLCFLGAIAVVIAQLDLLDSARDFQRQVESMGAWSAIVYPLIYAACNILLLPGGLLGVGAGFFFGLWWGFLIILCGNLLAAAVAFLLARTIARRWIEKLASRRPKLAALDHAITRQGAKIVILSQLHPLFPTSLLNYFYGVTRVPFRKCMLWVAIGQAPGLFLYCYLGTLGQLSLRLVQRGDTPTPLEYLLWGGGLVLTLAITAVLGSVAIRILKEVNNSDSIR